MVTLASNQAGGLGFLGGGRGRGRFLINGMILAGNVGNWMILFGGESLSPVTGSWSHPIPNFTIATRAAFWRTLVLTSMYSFPKKIRQAGVWDTAVWFLSRGWGGEG